MNPYQSNNVEMQDVDWPPLIWPVPLLLTFFLFMLLEFVGTIARLCMAGPSDLFDLIASLVLLFVACPMFGIVSLWVAWEMTWERIYWRRD